MGGGGGLENFLIIPLKWGELIREGRLIKTELKRRLTVNISSLGFICD